MNQNKKKRSSIRKELITKSREAALAGVQIFNNPNITFKSESYIVLMIIAWTYLMHAYYRQEKIEYRFFEQHGQRRRFDKTRHGAHKYWELERCLNNNRSPIDKDTSNNLRFLIGLRHEIEHQMTSRIDELLSARFQACCLNYNQYIKKLFGKDNGIDKHLSFSLQFSTIEMKQKDMLADHPELPANIQTYISTFDSALNDDEYADQRYAYRILFVPKTANSKGQADRVIEFIKSDSPLAEGINAEYTLIKETEKKKYLPGQIVETMQKNYPKFAMHNHTQLWKLLDAKNPNKQYGTIVSGNSWYWYENWVQKVKEHCEDNKDQYT